MDVKNIKELIGSLPTHRMAYSDRMALLMAVMAEMAYEKDVKKLETRLIEFGFTLVRHFDVNDTQAFYATREDFDILSFRGTENMSDAFTDALALPVTSKFKTFHMGFKKAFDCVSDDIKKTVEDSTNTIFVTGHSLGAALAIICCSEILSSDRVGACYTFGSPAAGDSAFDQSMLKFPVYRVVNGLDIVSRVPPWHAGTGQLTLLSFGKRIVGQRAHSLFFISYLFSGIFFFPMLFLAIFYKIIGKSFFFGLVSHHFMDGYISKLEKIADARYEESDLKRRPILYVAFEWARFVLSFGAIAVVFYFGYRSIFSH